MALPWPWEPWYHASQATLLISWGENYGWSARELLCHQHAQVMHEQGLLHVTFSSHIMTAVMLPFFPPDSRPRTGQKEQSQCKGQRLSFLSWVLPTPLFLHLCSRNPPRARLSPSSLTCGPSYSPLSPLDCMGFLTQRGDKASGVGSNDSCTPGSMQGLKALQRTLKVDSQSLPESS